MSKSYTTVQVSNVVLRRKELRDKLKQLKYPRGISKQEEDRLFDERLSIVQEIVSINEYLGDYDEEYRYAAQQTQHRE